MANEDPLEERAKRAAANVRETGSLWTASQDLARNHLDSLRNQRAELTEIMRVGGDSALGAWMSVASGIDGVDRAIAEVEAKIPELKPGLPDWYPEG